MRVKYRMRKIITQHQFSFEVGFHVHGRRQLPQPELSCNQGASPSHRQVASGASLTQRRTHWGFASMQVNTKEVKLFTQFFPPVVFQIVKQFALMKILQCSLRVFMRRKEWTLFSDVNTITEYTPVSLRDSGITS